MKKLICVLIGHNLNYCHFDTKECLRCDLKNMEYDEFTKTSLVQKLINFIQRIL